MKYLFKDKLIKKTALGGAILSVLSSAQAATINVDGVCSLQDAIQSANGDVAIGSCTAGSGDDVIQFVSPNDRLTINTIFEPSADGPGGAGLPVISSNITIEGNGLRITGNNNTENFRAFDVASTGDLTLRDTAVRGFDDDYGVGSGLFSAGRVTIENSTFYENNGGVLLYSGFGNVIDNSVIRHNFNTSQFAAGIQTIFTELEINSSSIFDNAHYNSALRGGPSGTPAGGLGFLQSDVTLSNSTVSGNNSGYGGGVIINNDVPLSLQSNVPQFGNSAFRGVIPSRLNISNSTITNNQSYIAAGLLQFGYDSEVNIQGSIIAGNVVRFNGYAANGYLFNPALVYLDANNIIGENSETGFSTITLGATDSTFSDGAKDNLYPLSLSNGQFVHPLKLGSMAIDGNDPSCFGGVTDQEGKSRGIDGDNNGSFICDVGAFEHSLPILANGAPCTLSNAIISANTDSSVGGCQPGLGHDIISLPANSTQTLNNVQAYFSANPYLGFGLPLIDSAITIDGNGSTIQRNSGAVDNFDILLVESGSQLNIFDTTITGANGGVSAILSFSGNLNLVNSTVSGNQVPGVTDFYSVNSSIVGTTIDGNSYNPVGYSGYYGALSILGSIGPEVFNNTISNNTGAYYGGGRLLQNSSMVVENNTITGNEGGNAGGLFVYNQSPRTTILNNNTITNNEGSAAGGLSLITSEPGALFMRNSIVSGNTATPAPPFTQRSSLVGLQMNASRGGGGGYADEISGSAYLNLEGVNIIGQNGVSGTVDVTLGANDIVPVGPTSTVINALSDNGGITQTHLPVAGGPAVDAINGSCGPSTDQLDRIRPWDGDNDGDADCDVGAVELGSVTSSDLIFKDGFDATIMIRRSLEK